MTTTSVKDVGSVVNLGIQAGSAASKTGAGSFQTVWSNQTGTKQAQQGQPAQKPDRVDDRAKPGDDLRVRKHSEKNICEDDAAQVQEAQDGLSEEELEDVMALIATAVTDLMEQIADTFGIPVESVQELMTDMNLQPADLLQPENLSNLLLEAGGAQDSLSLLTDGELYSDYQMLMEQGEMAVKTVSDDLEVTPQQVLQAAERMQEAVTPKAGETVTERFVQEDGEETAVQPAAESEIPENVQAARNAQRAAGDNDAGNAGQEREEEPGDTSGNLVLQSIRDDALRPDAEAVQESTGARDADTQDMMRQIMDYMKIQIKPEVSDLEMQLHPASLGTLQIHVASRGGVLTANFITQNETVKAALESQMVQLRESFEAQGVRVEAIEVTVQTHQFEQNLEQGRGRQPQDTSEAKRPRTRRIQLGGADITELPEELEQEDRLTAEMMAANGGTVDYTA